MLRRSFVLAVAWCAALLPFGLAVAGDGVNLSGPIVHANLAVYLVHGANAEGAVPISLQEALAGGQVKVLETGSVNELTVENVGDNEVFVQAGDIVKGGQQDRVLSLDLLLPPHSGKVSLAAFCVEAGRWTARGAEDAKEFSAAMASMPSPEANRAMRLYAMSAPSALPVAQLSPVLSSANLGAAAMAERQAQIWANVQKTQDRLSHSLGAAVAAPASPSSLELSLENDRLKAVQAEYTGALQNAGETGDDVVGYVFAVNGKIVGGDSYRSNALFRKMWPKLLTAAVTEAIAEKDAPGAAAPSLAAVHDFLAAAERAPQSVRKLNASVSLATRDGDGALYAETQRGDGAWVHRNYLAK